LGWGRVGGGSRGERTKKRYSTVEEAIKKV
jgi:hypothetical protein